jgi:hypothetical protein
VKDQSPTFRYSVSLKQMTKVNPLVKYGKGCSGSRAPRAAAKY